MWYSTLGGIVTLTLGLLIAPLAAAARPPGKISHIGVLSALFPPVDPEGPQRSPFWHPFWQGMRELGWMEGQNLVIEYRWAEGRFERLPALATELVQLKVDLILVAGGLETRAAAQATSTIPIVMFASLDAVEQGFVASLAHPGKNVTGVTTMTAQINPKRLELLKEVVPGSPRMTVLMCKDLPTLGQGWEAMQVTARALGVHLQSLGVREPDDYARAFAAAIREGAEAIFVWRCYFNWLHIRRIVALAARHRLPAIYGWRGGVQVGGLMSYGPNESALARRVATYVDKILKGAKPADLPVEQPMQFELVINLKTAKALGLTIPPLVLFQADEVIR
jgi:putative ABC transport system substrate-binding protein